MPEIKKNFSTGLAYLIERAGVKQKQLAQRIGISEQSLTDYKMGRRKGDEGERNRIADKLGFGLSENHIRQLGAMICSGVPGDEAFESISARVSGDEASAFKRSLDTMFSHIVEFLRDQYGEDMRVAIGFEQRFEERFKEYAEWKRELAAEQWEHEERK